MNKKDDGKQNSTIKFETGKLQTMKEINRVTHRQEQMSLIPKQYFLPNLKLSLLNGAISHEQQ